ncbi:amidohydrolase family protein [Streptomyces sp. NPDC001165]|uniref:amidohydrolase family protein n=1 Tax=Streptomyces sp. NPDC001165 TaxID=3364546 RepID=UPI0036C53B86
MIVDAQAHLWQSDRPTRPWPPGAGPAHREVPPTVEELLTAMDGSGVGHAVLVPPSWEGDRNDVVLAAADARPDRFSVMGRVAVHGSRWAWRLDELRGRPGVRGVRLTLHRSPWRELFTAGHLDRFWAAVERAGLPVMVYAPDLTGALNSVATAHPGLRLVLDHLCLPLGARDEAAFAGLDDLLTLARHPHVAVKASALPCHTTDAYPFRSLHEPLRRVFDTFGPHRMFWGSDWTRLPCPYDQAVTLFTEQLDFLRGRDKDLVMGDALMRWLDPPAAPQWARSSSPPRPADTTASGPRHALPLPRPHPRSQTPET